MATTGHESEVINVDGLKASLQKLKTDIIDRKYSKPSGGIPSDDLAQAVRDLLTAAGTALQSSDLTTLNNKVTALEAYFSSEADADTIINKWNEIVAFLAGIAESQTLDGIISGINDSISAKYTKPSGGIPASDLASDVQTALGKVDSAIQSHQSVSDNNPTLAWGTKSKVGTVGSTDLNVTMPANPNTDTSVTSVDNHYTPSADANSELTASLDGTEGSYALNTEYSVVTGVKAQRDAKGHITGIKVTKQKVKDTNTHTAPTSTEVKTALGTGSGTTKFLREDGTWQKPGGGATMSVVAISVNTSSSCSITGAGNSGKSETIIYTNSGSSDLTVTVPTTNIQTPDGDPIELTCLGGGYCEVNYINISGVIYARGL